mmetsp:Transcript_17196/g.36990  ORF Transcript_17196/g.36990 Transcript_17196/m.36990 type:complete len:300 (+) Transcript_17196:133-1032(+)
MAAIKRCASALRVAGVPEHFNAPFHLAKERGLYAKEGIDMVWKMEPKGTGAMAQLLEEGDADVAIMLSEGATAKAATGAPLKVVGTYVSSPLRWGVHVRNGAAIKSKEDLKGKVFGVSRMLSGSHLMAHLMAHQLGWDLAKDAPLKVVGSLDQARESMLKGDIDAWLWEKFTTKHLVDCGDFDIIGEVPTPWPCFLFLASEKAIAERPEELKRFIELTKPVCDEFKADEGGSTCKYVSKNHAMTEAEAAEWLEGTQWACAPEVASSTLKSTQEALVTIGQLDQVVPISQLVGSPCTIIE